MTIGAKRPATVPDPRLYVTNTLGNPFVEDENLLQIVQPIARSRKEANAIKRSEQITVVIGNPPYKEKAKGRGSWIEGGSNVDQTNKDIHAPMDRWKPPASWGVGAHSKHLKNLYIYFWRWATWKVFGSGWFDSTGLADSDREGIVCFISVAGFLNGPGFQKMRADLRASCSDIWIIDCSPERHQPEVATRIFEAVQQPVCITIAARKKGKDSNTPANVHYISLRPDRRGAKFTQLATISTSSAGWQSGPKGWRDPFLPAMDGAWPKFPALKDFFSYDGTGVLPGRLWAIAPDIVSLTKRWNALVDEKNPTKKELLFRPQLRDGKVASRHINKLVAEPLGNRATRTVSIADDDGSMPVAIRYSFRSFDRQWLIGDARLLNDVRPKLWAVESAHQVFLTALHASSPSKGPAATLTGLIPDQDHYKGSFGGRVFPLWADSGASQSNIAPRVSEALADAYGKSISAEDVMAYLAAVLAHPAFTARFKDDLVQPGLRVPVTADPDLFAQAVELGREITGLHTYGERFIDASALRPKGPPRLAKDEAPTIPAEGMIPGDPEPLPDTMRYEPEKNRLHVGAGYIDNVTKAMWEYEVSGKQIVWQWFSYRRLDRSRPIIGDRRPPSPLDSIQPDHWLPEYTKDLLDLLNVIGRLVKLEPRQAELLTAILSHPLIDVATLRPATDNAADSD